MEYFKSGLKSVLGATEPGALPTGAETVSYQSENNTNIVTVVKRHISHN